MDAVHAFWKPRDWSSFDVIRKVRPLVKPSKVGHTGTLDPFAEGILVLCFGKMTKKAEYYMDLEKEYAATVKLGSRTDTLDPTGKTVKTAAVPEYSDAELLSVLNSFTGQIKQIPPMFSALRQNGKRLYKLARKGHVVEREPREVKISSIKLDKWKPDEFRIRVVCGRGTYIRALARDIAEALGTVGYLTELVRTRIGDFTEENAVRIEELKEWISSAA